MQTLKYLNLNVNGFGHLFKKGLIFAVGLKW